MKSHDGYSGFIIIKKKRNINLLLFYTENTSTFIFFFRLFYHSFIIALSCYFLCLSVWLRSSRNIYGIQQKKSHPDMHPYVTAL